MIKIKLNKKRMRFNLILSIFWIGLGLAHFILDSNPLIIGILYLITGFLYLSQYIYDLKHHYLIIEDGIIKKNKLYGFKNAINTDKITEIKGTENGYLIKSDKINLKIDPSLIDMESLQELIQYLKNLDLPTDKNYFSKFQPYLN